MNVGMGIVFFYQRTHMTSTLWSAIPYFSISLSLNTLLTLMIITRLVLYARKTRTALGITGIGGLCKAIVIMLVESCTIYAVNSLVVGLLGAGNAAWGLLLAIIGEIQVRASHNPGPRAGCLMQRRIEQVIAPLLIILRAADKSALMSNTTTSERINDFEAPRSSLGLRPHQLGIGDVVGGWKKVPEVQKTRTWWRYLLHGSSRAVV